MCKISDFDPQNSWKYLWNYLHLNGSEKLYQYLSRHPFWPWLLHIVKGIPNCSFQSDLFSMYFQNISNFWLIFHYFYLILSWIFFTIWFWIPKNAQVQGENTIKHNFKGFVFVRTKFKWSLIKEQTVALQIVITLLVILALPLVILALPLEILALVLPALPLVILVLTLVIIVLPLVILALYYY